MVDRVFYSVLILLFINSNLCAGSEPGPRVVGGRDAIEDEAPYQVSIRLKAEDKPFGYGHICGGTLISNNTVVTAAHCLFDKDDNLRPASNFSLVMGVLDRYNKTGALEFSVKTIVYHSKYNSSTMENDVALMKLEGTVPADNIRIKPIELATMEMPDGETCQVTGWGSIRENSEAPAELQIADINKMEFNICNFFLNYELKKGMICAGRALGEVDSCQGDSGGPMVCRNLLVGIVSWGYGCARPVQPGIYTDVYYFKAWILNTTTNNAADAFFKQASNFSILMLMIIVNMFLTNIHLQLK